MAQPLINDIISALEEIFPPRYQENFDNTGLQVGSRTRPCTGALLCVDVTPDIISEAIAHRCNLIISHHPLIFHPLKTIGDTGRVDCCIVEAIKHDITIYSCHTSADNTPSLGVSWHMARMLGLTDLQPLESRGAEGIGSGIVGNLPQPLTHLELVDRVKQTFHTPVARCSALTPTDTPISRIALCGGAGSFLIPNAIAQKAQAFIAADTKHNQFIDHANEIFIVDIGHFESEECTKQIFYQHITEKFPNFALRYSSEEKNPITYL